MLVSPSDMPLARLLGATTSALPERYGADVLASAPRGPLAVQRKTILDLIASIEDGRLARELDLLKTAAWPVLVVEGQPSYTTEGYLVSRHKSRWTRRHIRNVLRSVWYVHGVRVEYTDDLQDTADAVRELVEWLGKATHRSLLVRPKAPGRDDWGTTDRRSWARFFLQGLPGIGVERAGAIYDTVGVPLRWTITRKELEAVPGVGPITAERIWRCFPDAGKAMGKRRRREAKKDRSG